MPHIDNDTRDLLISAFRQRVVEKLGVTPFEHQAEWWLASDGLVLQPERAAGGYRVQLADTTTAERSVTARPGGRARFLADLGAFKVGKSFGVALWATGFAAVPQGSVKLVGVEYDICEPEFSYLCEFLLSERGMNLAYDTLSNNPRSGKMYLKLKDSGARYEARSWERKDSLKGKEDDAYIYCEAYQLPGIECFTSFSQNLRARRGYAVFPTTPDRPWVKQLHDLGANHGGPDADPEWHCTCGVPAEVNPATFDVKAKARDAKIMTREKFQIHYAGKLGEFVGRVYNYQVGERLILPATHPHLFREGAPDDLRHRFDLPRHWEIVGGADTGTFYSAGLVAFDQDGIAYVLDEFPNYRYVGREPERDEAVTIPEWCQAVTGTAARWGARAVFWADKNSQFKGEVRNYGVTLLANLTPMETRTEIAREYFQHGKIWIAPWCKVLQFELENAAWPDESTLAGKFARIKRHDHTLDWLEHILSRRPLGRAVPGAPAKRSWAESMGYTRKTATGNVHMGVN